MQGGGIFINTASTVLRRSQFHGNFTYIVNVYIQIYDVTMAVTSCMLLVPHFL